MELDLGKGRIALIDDEDWTRVRKHTSRKGACIDVAPCELRWFLTANGYLQAGGNGKPTLLLHRLLTECPQDKIVDHTNGNPMDNRQCNIRVCDDQQNQRNRRKHCKTRCQFKGVMVNWHPIRAKPYRARVVVDGRKVHGGYYATQLEAALAYDDLAVATYGEFACLNFPERQRAKRAA